MQSKYQNSYSSLRLVFLILVISSVFVRVHAQQLRFMLDLTPQFSWFQTDYPAGVSTRGSVPGYNAGTQFNYFFSRNYAFTGGVKLLHTGGKLTYADTVSIPVSDSALYLPGNTLLTYTFDYVNIPLGLRFQSVEIGYIRFYAETGINILVRFISRVSAAAYNLSKEKNTGDTNPFNITYHTRLGMEYSLGGETSLAVGITYLHGLLDLTKNMPDKPNDRMIFHSLGLQLSIIF